MLLLFLCLCSFFFDPLGFGIRYYWKISLRGIYVHRLQSIHYIGKHGQIHTEKAAEGRVQIWDDVTEHTDGENGYNTHGQLHAISSSLQQQYSEKGKEPQCFQECPSVNKKWDWEFYNEQMTKYHWPKRCKSLHINYKKWRNTRRRRTYTSFLKNFQILFIFCLVSSQNTNQIKIKYINI